MGVFVWEMANHSELRLIIGGTRKKWGYGGGVTMFSA